MCSVLSHGGVQFIITVPALPSGMVTAVGLSSLQFVDLNSSRNLFVLGFSVLMGLVVPYYFEGNPDILKTGSAVLDQILMVMLTTWMFIGGLVGFLLGNSITGTDEKRGLLAWRIKEELGQEGVSDDETETDENIGEWVDQELQNTNNCTEELDVKHVGLLDNETTVLHAKPSMQQCYALPFVTRFIRNWAWCRYLPFSPTFEGFKLGRLRTACKKNR